MFCSDRQDIPGAPVAALCRREGAYSTLLADRRAVFAECVHCFRRELIRVYAQQPATPSLFVGAWYRQPLPQWRTLNAF
jgi:hypothetical protein